MGVRSNGDGLSSFCGRTERLAGRGLPSLVGRARGLRSRVDGFASRSYTRGRTLRLGTGLYHFVTLITGISRSSSTSLRVNFGTGGTSSTSGPRT